MSAARWLLLSTMVIGLNTSAAVGEGRRLKGMPAGPLENICDGKAEASQLKCRFYLIGIVETLGELERAKFCPPWKVVSGFETYDFDMIIEKARTGLRAVDFGEDSVPVIRLALLSAFPCPR